MSLRGYFLLFLGNAIGGLASPAVTRYASAADASTAPAATTVSLASSAGVDLFDAEAVQLTDDVLNSVKAQTNETDILAVFGFENSTGTAEVRLDRRSGFCKAFPGDWNYPVPAVWSLFDLLLGRALIKTVPVAAPCYKSSGVYDAAKCADISARFTTADLQ